VLPAFKLASTESTNASLSFKLWYAATLVRAALISSTFCEAFTAATVSEVTKPVVLPSK